MAIAESAPFSLDVVGDPVLSNPSHVGITQSGAEIYCESNRGGWELYWTADNSGIQPTPAQIVAGQNPGGASAVASGSAPLVINANGPFSARPFPPQWLAYYWFVSTDGVTYSNVVGGSFATLEDPASPGPGEEANTLVSFYDRETEMERPLFNQSTIEAS